MTIRLNQLKAAPVVSNPAEAVEVIIKVKRAGYVPTGVSVRARIDEHLFTADTTRGHATALELDPQVESIAANKKLRIVG